MNLRLIFLLCALVAVAARPSPWHPRVKELAAQWRANGSPNASPPSWFLSNTCPPGNTACQALLSSFRKQQPITITETLLNVFSIVQGDLSAQNFFVGHPTGIEIETVFNPAKKGPTPPDPNFPYTGATVQNFGTCHSVASVPPLNATADVCGSDLCNLNFVFYVNTSAVAECMPPGSNCQALSQYQEIGQISYQGVFGSCAGQPFYFRIPISGGSGIFAGAQGWILGLQIPSYEFFTYTIYFTGGVKVLTPLFPHPSP